MHPLLPTEHERTHVGNDPILLTLLSRRADDSEELKAILYQVTVSLVSEQCQWLLLVTTQQNAADHQLGHRSSQSHRSP